jgi:hypothetical protein
MSDLIAAVSAVSSIGTQSLGTIGASDPGAAATGDVSSFRAMVQEPSPSSDVSEVSGKLVDAGVNLSQRYTDRIDTARDLASFSADSLGVDHGDYMRAMLSVQIALNEVTVELQSTAQIANSVKDSFNALYRLQG